MAIMELHGANAIAKQFIPMSDYQDQQFVIEPAENLDANGHLVDILRCDMDGRFRG